MLLAENRLFLQTMGF